MSGDTVVSTNALQFTNDNKFAYAYSGKVDTASGVLTTLIEFNTNSEYIVGNVALQQKESGGAISYLDVFFNDVIVINAVWDNSSSGAFALGLPIPLIIPPFTKVTIQGAESNAAELTAQFTGKVGMPQRVGNLDD